MKKLLITIDGPAGAGKTTVSKLLAKRLGYKYIDTGALYRGIAVKTVETGVDIADDGQLLSMLSDTRLWFEFNGLDLNLFLDGIDISDKIRTPEISMAASNVSAKPVVREFLLSLQRKLGGEKSAVFEGRDMGTVVFPNADMKFFLEASLKERAKRRFEEFCDENTQTLEEVENQIAKRDHNDKTRVVAPLKPAADAVSIDSTNITPADVVELMSDHIYKRFE